MFWSTLTAVAVAASPGAEQVENIWGCAMVAGALCVLFALNAGFCAYMSMRRE
jgi:hypothetical protein